MRNRKVDNIGPTDGPAPTLDEMNAAALDVDHRQDRKPPAWTGRFAFSQQSCRFEIPVDVWSLETMAPREYLIRYAKITPRRITLYNRIFLKHRDGKLGDLGFKELDKALNDIMASSVPQDDLAQVKQLIAFSQEQRVSQKYFAGIAALAERMLYRKFLTEETQDLLQYQKEHLEACDFQNLRSRLKGLRLSAVMETLLYTLRDS